MDPYDPYYTNPRDSYPEESRRRRRESEELEYRRVKIRPETRDPLKEDYLLELREYATWIRERQRNRVFENDEIDTRYDQYKQSFMKNQNEKFFKTHAQSEWFRERYHPIESLRFKAQIHERKRDSAVMFKECLAQGKYDAILLDENSDQLIIEGTEKKPEGTEDYMLYRYVGLDIPKLPRLNVNGVFDNTKRADLDAFMKAAEAKYLEMSDPRLDKRNGRLAWLIYDLGTDLNLILPKVPDTIGGAPVSVSPARDKRTYVRVQVPYANKPERLIHDLEQTQRLAAHLDKEAGIEDGVGAIERHFNTLTVAPQMVQDGENEIDVGPTKKHLDLVLLYLHLIHYFDYYTGCVSYSAEDHDRRGALPVRKAYAPDGTTAQPSWATRLDQRINRIFVTDPSEEDVRIYGFRTMEQSIEQQLSLYLRQEAESKFRCTECQKLFKGDTFVRKHIRTKHEAVVAHVAEEVNYFNNFCGDLGKVEVKPPVRQSPYDSRERSGPSRRGSMKGRPDGRRSDPREMRAYHDLDAPAGGEVVLSYD